MPSAVSARASVNPVGPASYATLTGPGSPAQNSTTSPVLPGKRRERSSPDSRSAVTATTFPTRTSNPTKLLTFAMVGTSMIAVGAQANPGRSTRAPHARVPTLTPPTDRENGHPYGLGRTHSAALRRRAAQDAPKCFLVL